MNWAKTKIVATIGPACESRKQVKKMLEAGVDVFRFNTKHGTVEWHSDQVDLVREVSEELKHPVAIMIDLKGPDLRVGQFVDGGIELKKSDKVWFTPKDKMRKNGIVVEGLDSVKKLKKGQTVYLADAFMEGKITKIAKDKSIEVKIVQGGFLKSNKSINFPGALVDLPSLIKRDLEFLSMSAKKDVDFVAGSFIRNRKDIDDLKKVIEKEKMNVQVISKLENQQAIDNFEEILEATDGIMVARGDLGVEIPLQEVPYYQKLMIKRCREVGKPVIVATQMLESMMENPRPTRAEVSDVANAVYDATDAIMLSGETASGDFPIRAVETMTEISSLCEDKRISYLPEINYKAGSLTEAITFSAYKMSESEFLEQMTVDYFVVLTDSGKTARFLSRFRPQIPIIAITNNKTTQDQLCMSYGVKPFLYKYPKGKVRSTKKVLQALKKSKMVSKGDQVIVIYGKQWGVSGNTNTIRVEEVK